ncbi:TPA: hypothetical protein DDZ86_03710 [Candidatus Dependentiae bacterium]|nr:MAG: NTPase [candidate division TM6 bacterium GW2011_GWF2_43_87]HBL98722.1 hypothetical protein [Candidatus Dependentiae bacterium]
MKTFHVVLASTNPVKLLATHQAFAAMFPDIEINLEAIASNANTPAQPMSDEEALNGAMARVEDARLHMPSANFWVGIESGVHVEQKAGRHEVLLLTWAVVMGLEGFMGKGRGPSFYLPPELAATFMEHPKELNSYASAFFGTENIGKKEGTIGALTGGAITRTTTASLALMCALIYHKNPHFVVPQEKQKEPVL